MKLFLILFFACSIFMSFAQTETNNFNFNHIVTQVQGDLNNDGINDKVVVSQDTMNNTAPYRFQVFFVDKNAKTNLIASTSKFIEPQFPNGKEGIQGGNSFSDVTIKNGLLRVNNNLLRGNFSHTFKFQQGNFELIDFSETFSDGNETITSIKFNLITGIRVEKIGRIDSNKVIRKTKKKIILKSFPKLQDIIPFENELY